MTDRRARRRTETLEELLAATRTLARAEGWHGVTIRKIAAAVQGLSGIVNDVLTFAGQTTPDPRPVLAIDVIGKAIDAHFPAIDAAGVTVVRRDLHQPGLQLHVDANQLHQALLNVIRNAVDAMAEHEGERTLTLDAAADDAGVTLTVRDSGPGIDDSAIDRIFNPFFTTRGAGTGLGLAIVHRIIDVHGGAIRVSNAPGSGGAVVELVLPHDLQSSMCDVGSEEAAVSSSDRSQITDRRKISGDAA